MWSMFDLIADDVVLRVRWVAGPPRPSQLGMALVLMPYQSAVEKSDRNHIRIDVSVRLPIPRRPRLLWPSITKPYQAMMLHCIAA